jgi:glyoxylase-like metal-dependent hydrolase (beta-lactamase superfamily II)
MGLSRRLLLRNSLVGTCALALSPRGFTDGLPEPLAADSLAEHLVQITGAGANVVVLVQPDGLLLIDGGVPERSAELLDFIAARWPTRPIQTLFNTNWRWEHTGSNAALGRAGATIMAHENTKLWLGADFAIEWDGDLEHAPYPREALPTQTFYTGGNLAFGSEPVTYGYLPQAHTDGDVYLHFPNRNVLVVSDLLSVGSYPIVDYVTGGWLGGMANAAQELLALADTNTKIIPAVGPVQSRADLQRYHEMCLAVKDRVARLIKSGLSLEESRAAAPTADFDAQWGDPDLFVTLVYKGLWAHVRELGGIL